ncbi:MAG: glycoside hydrolase family 43 protein [Verrucomicrobiota bacterium]
MKRTGFHVAFAVVIFFSLLAGAGEFRPGEVWLDAAGRPINAHAGGVIFEDGRYYWHGQPMTALPAGPKYPPSAGNLTEVGVNCYSSTNLYDWRYEGVALAVSDNPADDLYKGLRIERPKVLRCPRTGKFVMWFHYVRSGKMHAESYEAAVCVADRVTGPFRLVKIFRPNSGQMVRDCTLFQDDDGAAYFFYASEKNKTMHVVRLTDDYLDASERWERILVEEEREAPAVFKYQDRYYLISSGCTGWRHNPAGYAVADHPLGPWKKVADPCVGPNAANTFDTQGTFVLPVHGRPGAFIFMADRWNTTNMAGSGHVWLPIHLNGDSSIELRWTNRWDLSIFK